MSTISIIVPVYKVEEYLPACIRSILRQTYRDFELILVDDGSPDRCGEICDEFAKQDERIRVIHQENGGVSKARNTGLEAANGDWICFIDSDDEILENYLRSFIDNNIDNVDFLLQGSTYYYSDSTCSERKWKQETYSIHDFLAEGNEVPACVWGSSFRKSIIKKFSIKFKEGVSNAEDALFSSIYFLHVSSLRTIEYAGYRYRANRANSASLSINNPTSFLLTLLEVYEKQFILYHNNGLTSNRPSPPEIQVIKNGIVELSRNNPADLSTVIFTIKQMRFLKAAPLTGKDRLFFSLARITPIYLFRYLLLSYRFFNHATSYLSTRK